MEKQYDLVIIGSGPAGLAAAIYAQRAKLDTLVIEKEMMSGGQVLTTYEVDNYPGLPGIGGYDLGLKFREHADQLGAAFAEDDVVRIEDQGKIKRVVCEHETYESRALILATGAVHRKLGIPGEEELAGMGVSYCATCDGAFFRGKDVAIVGGGNTALEDALYLANVCRTVYLVHRRDAFRGEKALADRVRQKENIKIQYDSAVSKIRGESAVSSVLLENTKTGAQQELPVSAVFVAIGLIPENEIFSRQLPLDDNGYFVAGEDCKTPLEGVFVAGDCRSKLLRQIITAAADGAVAGYQAAAYVNGI